MLVLRSMAVLITACGLSGLVSAQDTTGGQRGASGAPQGAPPATPQGGRRGGGGGRGGAFQTMTLTTTAWPDGGLIPLRYSQMGPEVSPAIQWSTPPAGTASFVLLFHDLDYAVPNSTDDLLQWMVWNIPGTATGIAQGRPDGFELPDGSRQISVSGSRYRGPGASATGPMHHYVMELYALDTMLDIKVDPQGPQDPNPNPQAIRTSVMQAMMGHIRAKAAYVGLFRRPQ
ncbi:MAG TPA: YbhB/YbcL family Raf kinase inhibitor-like protein [Bryobacteraceae bacterium]|nr:YbhB/YbcL family Raf kinase inhibitor-like protein [Bryobacteraceae bacterium]